MENKNHYKIKVVVRDNKSPRVVRCYYTPHEVLMRTNKFETGLCLVRN